MECEYKTRIEWIYIKTKVVGGKFKLNANKESPFVNNFMTLGFEI